MNYKTHELLYAAARAFARQRRTVNSHEIRQKINELKYLSSQRTVPRLSIRKELVHLEHKLEHVDAIEEQLVIQKRREKRRIAGLKGQITRLKKQLGSNEDKDMHRKVDHLHHVLGASLAKKEVVEDIERQKLLNTGAKDDLDASARLQMMVQLVQHIEKKLQENPQPRFDMQVQRIKEKLVSLGAVVPEEPVDVKHTLLFDTVAEPESQAVLPLPPPPRIRIA